MLRLNLCRLVYCVDLLLTLTYSGSRKQGVADPQPSDKRSEKRAGASTTPNAAAKPKAGPGRPPRDIDAMANTTLLGLSEAHASTPRRLLMCVSRNVALMRDHS